MRDYYLIYGGPFVGFTLGFLTKWKQIFHDMYCGDYVSWPLTYVLMLTCIMLVIFATIKIFDYLTPSEQ